MKKIYPQNRLQYISLLFLMSVGGVFHSYSQCPTVTDPIQSFCNIPAPLISDLVANDTGGGVQWYATPTSTTPLSNSALLINGNVYYAGDTAGLCGAREGVTVSILGPPFGLNFQGVCVDDPSDATLSNLFVIGNDVQWYNVPVGGTPLPPSTILTDNTIYYADQSNPITGCRTSRLTVFVHVVVVAVPTGDSIQEFCNDPNNPPTIADLVTNTTNNWYISAASATPLNPSTPLVDGETYYATTVVSPCESIGRFEVLVALTPSNDSGQNGAISICETDVTIIHTVDLFPALGGSPWNDGVWSGPFPLTNGNLGTVDVTGMTVIGSPYVFTYTVSSSILCPASSSTVSIVIVQEPNAGMDSTLDLCIDDGYIDLFTVLEGMPEVGGTWSPPLSSGTGVFNPSMDSSGIYTYIVTDAPPCGDNSATVTVNVYSKPDAGVDGSLQLCSGDGLVDLFTILDGTPDAGGSWNPALTSGTGVFDPSVDASGIYTYTVAGTPPCGDDNATVTVSVILAPNAGLNVILDLCENDGPVDLFTILGDSPDTGGTWSPALSSGTGVFDPSLDAEGIYTYTVFGTSPCGDDSANVTVTVISASNAGVDSTLELCSDDGLVDLFTVLGGTPDAGGSWNPALTSGTGVFDPSVDASGIYIYTVAGTPPCGDDNATVTVSVILAPNAGLNAILDLCENDGPINLFTILGNSPDAGGTWSPVLSSGTGVFDPSLDAEGIYTYTVFGTSPCGDDSANVTVTVISASNAGVDSTLELCSDDGLVDLFTVLGGTPDIGGTWSPALSSGTGIFDPVLDAPGVYTYTITGTSPCGNDSANVTVAIISAPDAGLDGVDDLCSNDSPVDLFTLLGGTPEIGGTWTPVLSSGSGIFDPQLDLAGVYTYTVNGTAPCGNDAANVTVTIVPAPNAGQDGTIDLCADSSSVDLFTVLGGTPDIGGTWSPTLVSGTGIFDPALDAPGVYTYTVAGTSPCGNDSANVTVAIISAPDAGLDGVVDLCSNDSPVDLFTLLGGTPEIGGTWSPALSSGTGIFNPQLDPAGIYTYTVNGTAPCGNDSANVTITMVPAPDAGQDGVIDLCVDSSSVDLFTILGGTPDSGGTWSPTLSSGSGIFDPQLDVPGIYTYTVIGTPPCGDDSANVTVTVTSAPNAGLDATIDLCENDSQIDLFTILGGTPDTGGTWSPTLSSGSEIFDPALDMPGVYTYTVAGTPPCGDDSANVTVTVTSAPDAGLDGTLDLCENDGQIDLFTILGGTPETGGTWSPTLSSGTGIFNPQLDPAGIYTYTVIGTPPCGDDSANVTVTVTSAPNAGLDATIDLCENDGQIDLFTILGGTPDSGGTWSPTLSSGSGIFDPQLDVPGIYTYTVIGISPCGNDSANVTVTVATAPDAGLDGTLDICNNDGQIDLFTVLGGTPDTGGTWSPTLVSGTGIFDPDLDAPGVYTYTVAGTSPCGNDSANVTVAIISAPDAGLDGVVDLCSNDSPVDLFTLLGGTPEMGGTWSPALSSGTGIFDPHIDPAGIYTYTVNGIPPCGNDSANVTVTVTSAPDAGLDGTLDLCENDGQIDLFTILGGTPDSGGTWSPALTSGSGVFDPQLDLPGVYTYTIIGTPACGGNDSANITVTITSLPDVTGAIMTANDPICTNSSNDVEITGADFLTDGLYTLTYELTGANSFMDPIDVTFLNGNTLFTIPASQLTNIGVTTLTITNLFIVGNSCGADVSSIAPIQFTIETGETPELITNGNEFCINDNPTIFDLSANVIDTTSIVWYDASINGNPYSETSPLVDGETYYGSITSVNGCESGVRLEVTVSIIDCNPSVVIPDGFSPNGDGINDTFNIKNLRELYPNFTLEIYNRYGNVLYKGNRNSPDWDGTSNTGVRMGSSELPVGVYFYILNYNQDGKDPVQGRVYLSR